MQTSLDANFCNDKLKDEADSKIVLMNYCICIPVIFCTSSCSKSKTTNYGVHVPVDLSTWHTNDQPSNLDE